METKDNNNEGTSTQKPFEQISREERDALKAENMKLIKENEELRDNLTLYKSLHNTESEQNKSLNARLEAIKQICQI